MFRREKVLGFVSEPMVSVFRDYGVVFKDDYDNLNVTAEDRSIYQLVEPGWLVVNRMKAWQGSVGVSAIRGISSGHYICFRPLHTEDHRYLNWLVRSGAYRDWFAAHSRGVRPGQAEIDNSYLGALPVLVPPLNEQRCIADYLDRETAEIAAMDAELDRLVETLRERRNANILDAMTPADGVFTRIKYTADVSLGKTFQGNQKRDDELLVNYVRAASIQTYGLALDDQRMWMTPDELEWYQLLAGDVLIVEGGAGYGRSVVLERDMPDWGFQNHVIRVRPWPDWHGPFLDWAVKAQFASGLIDILVDGATIPALSSDKARELPVLDIPLEDQQRVAAQLAEQTVRIDDMIADASRLKALLAERRSTLITEVVTGAKEVPA